MKNELKPLKNRLNKIGIEMSGNVPWIYLDKVNGKRVQEKLHSEHYFTVAFYSSKGYILTDLKEIFKIIRKYR